MNKIVLSILTLSGVLLATGCNTQQRTTQRSYQPAPAAPYDSYDVWVGPGWYYGVYFYNRGHYYNWQHRHYRRGGWHRHRGRHWGGHHGGRHRGGRHHGGGRHRGGRGRR